MNARRVVTAGILLSAVAVVLQIGHAQPAGDVLFVPAGTIHSAKNVGPGTASELATYITERERPLLTLVK